VQDEERLQAWLFPQRWFRENLKRGAGGEEGIDNEVVRQPARQPVDGHRA